VLAVNFQLPEKSGFAWAQAIAGRASASTIEKSATRFSMFFPPSFEKVRREPFGFARRA
jgi:hypothetical protein